MDTVIRRSARRRSELDLKTFDFALEYRRWWCLRRLNRWSIPRTTAPSNGDQTSGDSTTVANFQNVNASALSLASITGTAAANTVIGGSGNDTIDGAGGGGDTIDGAGGADVAVLVGSLRKGALTRKVAKALIHLAPKPLDCCMLEIGDLPLYNEGLDGGPPVAWNRADLGLLHVANHLDGRRGHP
jgi:hypothetical protein